MRVHLPRVVPGLGRVNMGQIDDSMRQVYVRKTSDIILPISWCSFVPIFNSVNLIYKAPATPAYSTYPTRSPFIVVPL